MVRFVFLLFLAFIANKHAVYSQENKFDGSIMYSEKKNLAFSVDLYIEPDYAVKGKLKRINKEGIEVSSLFTGTFNPENNSIYIQELKSKNNSCPIYINAFVKNIFDDFFVIAGIFQSSNKEFCDSGHINLVNKNFKFNLYNRKVNQQALNDSLNNILLKKLLQFNIDKDKTFIPITSSDNVRIKLTNDTFVIKIYDNLKIDGDRVKITFNEKVVSNNLAISGNAFLYFLIAKKGENILKIKALNEGSIPTNTSKVELYNYRFHDYYENKLYKNQEATYIIDYE